MSYTMCVKTVPVTVLTIFRRQLSHEKNSAMCKEIGLATFLYLL